MVTENRMPASITDLTFSPLVVGTAQFGLPYGIANRTGQPRFSEVCDIIRCAIENGATTFDTAAVYGKSEEILGRALHEIGAHVQVTIITKAAAVSKMDKKQTPAHVDKWIRGSVETSLKRLRLEQLPLCLFHDSSDVEYMDVLLGLKEKGLVKHVGVSVMRPDQFDAVLSTPGVEAIQIAASLFDQRMLRSGKLARAVRSGMVVFIRSIYLQGLIVMPEDAIHEALRTVIPVRRQLETVASEAGMSIAEMALRYAMSLPGVTGVLTGVETVGQMKENAAMARRGTLDESLMRKIAQAVPDFPETILFPWHWPGAIR